ncbi:tRNA intron endonuclease [Colletotrichum plurivorum]|uniref:tRNA-splicing endonuclease subunit Sen34 n=1 Tax=Colletotrichum plurivorum TaxID=2175906 RepID=A0A8H6MYU1_9PEZI|nr:tRNA intron endonuclease [Colletotrichum plurivorum]
MAASETPRTIARISKIADRYLVFDAEDVALIRRHHNICSVLVGTTPQNPTQNVFLSLPLELLPEEASLLVEKKVGNLVDETAHHTSSLRSMDKVTRSAYLGLLKDRYHKARKILADDQSRKVATEKTWRQKNGRNAPIESATQTQPSGVLPKIGALDSKSLAVTPTTSSGLHESPVNSLSDVTAPCTRPLHRHLQARGYFVTPGLRFGADYSVYPGDPLRFHAHFLATHYDQDDKISMLDLVGSGRLGTSVKKGFLFGGEISVPGNHGIEEMRTFCVEWAGM